MSFSRTARYNKDMKKIILILLLVLQACGKASDPVPVSLGSLADSECKIEDVCTYANVPGYECQTVRMNSETTCVITKEDYEFSPGCDPSNPDKTCQAWGHAPYPCCQTIQGPGPSAH